MSVALMRAADPANPGFLAASYLSYGFAGGLDAEERDVISAVVQPRWGCGWHVRRWRWHSESESSGQSKSVFGSVQERVIEPIAWWRDRAL